MTKRLLTNFFRRYFRLNVSARHTHAFSLIEILVVITIIAILAAMLLPALKNARDKAKQAGCAHNLKQIGIAFSMYAIDNDGYYPAAYYTSGVYNNSWDYWLWPYLGIPDGIGYMGLINYWPKGSILSCPLWTDGDRHDFNGVPRSSYGYNATVLSLKKTDGYSQSAGVVVADRSGSSRFIGQSNTPYLDPGLPETNPGINYLHSGMNYSGGWANFLFLDGHVRAMTPTEFANKTPSGLNVE